MTKRESVEKYVLKLTKTADPSGYNTKRYQDKFTKMTDKEFEIWVSNIRDKKDQLVIYAPNLKNSINATSAAALNELTGTKVFERLRLKDTTTGRTYLTPKEYLVLPLAVRRVKQFLMHKISVPRSDKKTDLLSGQVVRPDKGSSVSLIEMQTIMDKGLDKSVIELLKIRGGDAYAYSEFTSKILEEGSVSLSDMDLASSSPRSAVITNVFFKSMHIDNNF